MKINAQATKIILLILVACVIFGLYQFLKTTGAIQNDQYHLSPSVDDSHHTDNEKPILEGALKSSTLTQEEQKSAQAGTLMEPELFQKLKPAEQSKIKIMNEVILSKNDNDPRLDTELKVLSSEMKLVIQKKYDLYKPEDRNAKGTAVFLLGRNIEKPQDMDFFERVLKEKPCLSLSDCNKLTAQEGDHYHHSATDAKTQAYPQLVDMQSLAGKVLELNELSHLSEDQQQIKERAIAALRAAAHSEVPEISRRARALLKTIGQ